jgi:tetratricopeptide (TPR) repeat protein
VVPAKEEIVRLDTRYARLPGILSLVVVLGLAFAPVARADGGGGGNNNAPSPGKCDKGDYFSDKTGKCEKLKTGALSDPDLAQYAYLLAQADRYDEAIAALDLLKNPNTAVALNYRGYATRKLGRLDEGIGYYLQSVALDPHYAKVREYLGEAYVLKGEMANAQQQLESIKAICGTKCTAYEHLSEAIAEGPNACGTRYAAQRCASRG